MSNISVSVTADVADLTAKRAILSAELKAASADLRGFAEAARTGGATDELKASMLEAGAAVAKTKAEIVALTAEMKGASAEGATLSASMRNMRDTGMEVNESFRGIGEAFIAAFAVEQVADITKKLADNAEETQHVAETFGTTTDAVQRLKAEAAGLGVPFEAFTNAMQREDRALVTAREGSKQTAEAFKALGIDIKAPVDQATLLQEGIAGLANIQDVPTRLGLAMQIFGRNIQNLGPLIGATKEQIAAITSETDRFGAVNKDAQEQGLALADAYNEQKIALMGLGNTVLSALGPSLTDLVKDITGLIEAFREWASQGDNLKNAVTALTIAAAALASVLAAGALAAAVEGLAGLLGGVLVGALGSATVAMLGFDVAADANPIGAIVLAVEALVAGLVLLYQWLDKAGVITEIANAATPAWSLLAGAVKLVGDFFAPLVELIGQYQQAQARLDLAALAALWRDLANWIGQVGQQVAQLNRYVEDLNPQKIGEQVGEWGAKTLGLKGDYEGLNTTIGNAVTAVGDFLKANFPGIVQTWDSWVNTLKNDINQLVAAWDSFAGVVAGGPRPAVKPTGGNAGTGDTMAPQASPHLGGGGRKHGGSDKMEEYRTQLAQMEDQTRASTGAWLADLSQMDLDYWNGILEHAKLSSKQRTEIERTVAELTRRINGEAQTDVLTQDRAMIAENKGNIPALTLAWQVYVNDMVAAYGAGSREVIKANGEMAAAMQAATREADRGMVEDILASLKKEEEAQKQSYDRMIAEQKRAAEEAKRQWDRSVGGIVKSFGDGLLKMAEGTESFGQLMRSIGQKIATDWVNNISKMVSDWLRGIAQQVMATQAGETAKNAAKRVGAAQGLAIDGLASMKEVVNSAATAAGKAYQAMAGIPVVGPALGAAAAAAVFGAVIAFKGMIASAAGGYDIPAGVNPMTQLHAQEMVLPARLANPMRDMLAGGGGPWGGGGSPSIDLSGHTYNFHGAGGQPSDFRQMLADHRHELTKQVYQAVREGSRAPRGMSSPFTA